MKRHNFDGISFFSGLAIAAIGLLFLIPNSPSDIIDAITGLGTWFWPLLFVVVGVAVVIPVLMPRKIEQPEIDVSDRLSLSSAGSVEGADRDEENHESKDK